MTCGEALEPLLQELVRSERGGALCCFGLQVPDWIGVLLLLLALEALTCHVDLDVPLPQHCGP